MDTVDAFDGRVGIESAGGGDPTTTPALRDKIELVIPLSAAESPYGETAYNTMQILKSNPLAETIYRKVAMPMIDQIINANQQAAKMQQEIERIEREQAAREAAAETPPATPSE